MSNKELDGYCDIMAHPDCNQRRAFRGTNTNISQMSFSFKRKKENFIGDNEHIVCSFHGATYTCTNGEPGGWRALADGYLPIHIVKCRNDAFKVIAANQSGKKMECDIVGETRVRKTKPTFLQWHLKGNKRNFGVQFINEKEAQKFHTLLQKAVTMCKQSVEPRTRSADRVNHLARTGQTTQAFQVLSNNTEGQAKLVVKVLLPQNQSTVLSVSPMTTLYELLVQISEKRKMDPNAFAVRANKDRLYDSVEMRITTIGSLGVNEVRMESLSSMESSNKAEKLQMLASHTNTDAFAAEEVFVQVHLPNGGQTVVKVPSDMKMAEFLFFIAKKRNLDVSNIELSENDNPKKLKLINLKTTVGRSKKKEVYIVNKRPVGKGKRHSGNAPASHTGEDYSRLRKLQISGPQMVEPENKATSISLLRHQAQKVTSLLAEGVPPDDMRVPAPWRQVFEKAEVMIAVGIDARHRGQIIDFIVSKGGPTEILAKPTQEVVTMFSSFSKFRNRTGSGGSNSPRPERRAAPSPRSNRRKAPKPPPSSRRTSAAAFKLETLVRRASIENPLDDIPPRRESHQSRRESSQLRDSRASSVSSTSSLPYLSRQRSQSAGSATEFKNSILRAAQNSAQRPARPPRRSPEKLQLHNTDGIASAPVSPNRRREEGSTGSAGAQSLLGFGDGIDQELQRRREEEQKRIKEHEEYMRQQYEHQQKEAEQRELEQQRELQKLQEIELQRKEQEAALAKQREETARLEKEIKERQQRTAEKVLKRQKGEERTRQSTRQKAPPPPKARRPVRKSPSKAQVVATKMEKGQDSSSDEEAKKGFGFDPEDLKEMEKEGMSENRALQRHSFTRQVGIPAGVALPPPTVEEEQEPQRMVQLRKTVGSKDRNSTDNGSSMPIPPRPDNLESNTIVIPPRPDSMDIGDIPLPEPAIEAAAEEPLAIPPRPESMELPIPNRPLSMDISNIPLPDRPVSMDLSSVPLPDTLSVTQSISLNGSEMSLPDRPPSMDLSNVPLPDRPISMDISDVPLPSRPISMDVSNIPLPSRPVSMDISNIPLPDVVDGPLEIPPRTDNMDIGELPLPVDDSTPKHEEAEFTIPPRPALLGDGGIAKKPRKFSNVRSVRPRTSVSSIDIAMAKRADRKRESTASGGTNELAAIMEKFQSRKESLASVESYSSAAAPPRHSLLAKMDNDLPPPDLAEIAEEDEVPPPPQSTASKGSLSQLPLPELPQIDEDCEPPPAVPRDNSLSSIPLPAPCGSLSQIPLPELPEDLPDPQQPSGDDLQDLPAAIPDVLPAAIPDVLPAAIPDVLPEPIPDEMAAFPAPVLPNPEEPATIACPSCGIDNKAQAKFCADCGMPVTSLPAVPLPNMDDLPLPAFDDEEDDDDLPPPPPSDDPLDEIADLPPAVAVMARRQSTELLASIKTHPGRSSLAKIDVTPKPEDPRDSLLASIRRSSADILKSVTPDEAPKPKDPRDIMLEGIRNAKASKLRKAEPLPPKETDPRDSLLSMIRKANKSNLKKAEPLAPKPVDTRDNLLASIRGKGIGGLKKAKVEEKPKKIDGRTALLASLGGLSNRKGTLKKTKTREWKPLQKKANTPLSAMQSAINKVLDTRRNAMEDSDGDEDEWE